MIWLISSVRSCAQLTARTDTPYFPPFSPEDFCFFAVWLLCVQKDQKRLSDGFQFLNGLFFCQNIIFSRKLSDTSICCDNQPNCRMVMNHLLCPDRCRFCKGDLMFKPWRFTWRSTSFSIWPLAPSTIYPTQSISRILTSTSSDSLTDARIFRNKFRLCCHDRRPRRRLGKLILCPFSCMFICHVGQDQEIHKALDKCWLACPNRTYNSNIRFPRWFLLSYPCIPEMHP